MRYQIYEAKSVKYDAQQRDRIVVGVFHFAVDDNFVRDFF